MATTDGGTVWNVESVPPTVRYLTAVSCASIRTCTAVGQVGLTGSGPGAILTTVDGGATWVLQVVPTGTTDVTAIDCRAGVRCAALGVVDGRVTALSPSSTDSWGAGGTLPGVAAATALSCIDTNFCWATATQSLDIDHVVGTILATSDGGATWTLQRVPAGAGALRGINCHSGTMVRTRAFCTAVGTTSTVIGGARVGQGVVLTTGTGGTSWVAAPLPPTTADLLGLSCSASSCVAVGTTDGSTSQAGVAILSGASDGSTSGWRRASVTQLALPLIAISCATSSACVFVGESITARLPSS